MIMCFKAWECVELFCDYFCKLNQINLNANQTIELVGLLAKSCLMTPKNGSEGVGLIAGED